MSGEAAPPFEAAAHLQRSLVTPEGVDLRLTLASVGQRLSAFLIDAGVLLAAMIVATLAALSAGAGLARSAGLRSAEPVAVIWLLGFFLLRNGYFLGFEMSARAASPGKRLLGLRVASRDGARLTADAVFARNALREVELFLPLGFLFAGGAAPLASLAGLGWAAGLLLLPLLHPDHQRAGDLIAGTWVVREPRRPLRRDVAGAGEALAERFAFTPAQLDEYGERELQALEEVLRRGHPQTVHEVAARIRRKIAWSPGEDERDLDFLDAFYAAQRRKLEGDLLFGRRRRHKADRPAGPQSNRAASSDGPAPSRDRRSST